MNNKRKADYARMIELVTTYKNGLGNRYSGWTEKDYRNTLAAACAIIHNMEALLAREKGLEPGEWLTMFALQIQLDD